MGHAPSLFGNSRISRRAKWAALMLGLAGTAGASVESGLDPSIRPGDDFYAYANGEWLKSTQIPARKGRWQDRNQFDLTTNAAVLQLVEQAAGAAPGSNQRKVADYYSAYVDEGRIEARGLAPVKTTLKQVDDIHGKRELAGFLGAGLRID